MKYNLVYHNLWRRWSNMYFSYLIRSLIGKEIIKGRDYSREEIINHTLNIHQKQRLTLKYQMTQNNVKLL